MNFWGPKYHDTRKWQQCYLPYCATPTQSISQFEGKAASAIKVVLKKQFLSTTNRFACVVYRTSTFSILSLVKDP
jgi:hypothetical protein